MAQDALEQQFHHAMQAYLSGDLEQADNRFSDITNAWPECIEAWFQRAELAEKRLDFDAAIQYYEAVLEQDPTIQEVWFRLGHIAAQQNASELTYHYWERALEINPDYGDVHLHLGLFLARKQDPRAKQHFQKACALSTDILSLLSLARTLLWQNQHAVAAPLLHALCRQLETASPQQPEYYRHALGLNIQLVHELAQDDLAKQIITEAKIDAPDRETLNSLYLSLNASEETLKHFIADLPGHPRSANWPVEHLPRLLSWQKHQVQSQVHQYLYTPQLSHSEQQSTRLKPEKHTHSPFKLACIFHESSISLWPVFLNHLKTLPARQWQIHLILLHRIPLPLQELKAQLHILSIENVLPQLSKINPDLIVHGGADRQNDATALARDCQSLETHNLSWTPYSPDEIWKDTPQDPCFSGVLQLKALQSPYENALHLHRWSVHLHHHLVQGP